jgi:glutamate synthase (NADPH/NADH) large chain
VNSDAVASGEITLSALDPEDEVIVRTLVERHQAETDSPKARELLAGWDEAKARFTRVLPSQYARVRERLAQIEAEGGNLEAPGAWAEFLEATRG